MIKKFMVIIFFIQILPGSLLGMNKKDAITSVNKDSLDKKRYGVEINMAGLLMSTTGDIWITGTFTRFNVTNFLEIAFPYQYINETETKYQAVIFDIQPRFYLQEKQEGIYLSVNFRYANEYGKGQLSNRMRSINRYGPAFGVGARYFSEYGLYWGWSFYVGIYVFDSYEELEKDEIGLTRDRYGNIELLKFGFYF
ncbi:MAG: hypothetical protein J7K63_00540 [Candidatus Marinimicrobia bacterium]|nr:hypothetical protein [Candidatus Neomarinimicrobiota bacterium]